MSVTEICNLALGHLGQAHIDHIDEASTEARECKRFYAAARDAALRGHDWDFARVRAQLAALAETVPDWAFVYQLPADCLAPRWLVQADRNARPIRFRVEGRRLLTDQDSAVLAYTARIADVMLFDDSFIEALSYKLASHLALPLTEDLRRRQMMEQLFASALLTAKVDDANQDQSMPDWVPDWIEERG